MKNKLISFIVPVYNDEKYIERCLESICHQTYTNWEAIVIDDGSTDNSGSIIDRFANDESRIKVFHKENEGVSNARNDGIENASGEYFCFIDGDDYIEEDYAIYFVNLAKKNDCEIVVNRNHFNPYSSKQVESDEPCLESSEALIRDMYLGKLDVAVWNKIYSAKFIKEHNICFNSDIWYGEGLLFNIDCFSKAKKIFVGEKKVYHQEFNPYSAMRSFKIANQLCGMKSMELQKEIIEINKYSLKAEWLFHYRLFYIYILKGLIQNNLVKENKKEFNNSVKKLRSNFLLPFVVDISNRRRIMTLFSYVAPITYVKLLIKKENKKIHRIADI